jgi:hypothetical protein
MDKEIIMILINKLPGWFIMLGVSLLLIDKICGNNIKAMIRLMAKHNARKDRLDRLQNEKIERIFEDIEEIKKRINN